MNKSLLAYIPREYKPLVTDIYDGDREWNDHTKKWNTNLIVEWQNGETSYFANKTFARECLKEFHSPDEYM